MGQELVQHGKLGAGYIHRITNWRFQDTASRLDLANQFTQKDVDKVCYDMELDSYYILKAVDFSSGAPTWYALPSAAPELQGEVNTAENIGSGVGVYAGKSGITLQFKSIVQGENTVITVDGETITINAVVPDIPEITDPEVRTMTAGDFVGGNRVVSATDESHVIYTDPEDFLSSRKVMGITKGAANVDTEVPVQVSGVMEEPGWSWTPDQDIFVLPAGGLTQTAPTTGFLIRAGIALTSTSMLIKFEPLIQLA